MLKKKICILCRRGIKELDIIMSLFFNKYFDNLNSQDKFNFYKLLKCEDNDIYDWIIGNKKSFNKNFKNIISIIKNLKF